MTELIWVAIIAQLGGIVVAIIGGWRKLGSIASDAKVAREQTANEHDDAEYPNMRDELTSTRRAVEELATKLEKVSASGERTESHVRDVDQELKAIGHQFDRHIRIEERARESMSKEVPVLINAALIEHVAACPLRQKMKEEK